MSYWEEPPVKNAFVQQFSENIKFKYSCFDRVILRGYILWLFFPAGVVNLLYAMGFRKLSNGVMRILTDQLNAHIQKVAQPLAPLTSANLCRRAGIGKVPEIIGGINDGQKVLPSKFRACANERI